MPANAYVPSAAVVVVAIAVPVPSSSVSVTPPRPASPDVIAPSVFPSMKTVPVMPESLSPKV